MTKIKRMLSMCIFETTRAQVFCPEHVRYVKTPLDTMDGSSPPKPIQVGPCNALQAGQRFGPKMLLNSGFVPLPPTLGRSKAGNKNQVRTKGREIVRSVDGMLFFFAEAEMHQT